MKTTLGTVVIIGLVASLSFAEEKSTLSPAERKIAQAEKAIEKNPQNHRAYDALALAFARRARETSDTAYYQRALDALRKSFEIRADNLDAQRTEIWILLGQHEFARALEKAQALNRRVPDDVLTYGFLTDANVELGNYEAAENAAQWMPDIRPGNVPGLTRAAYLREIFGDLDGALELMRSAYDQTPPDEVEDRAWILTQVAHVELSRGNVDTAAKILSDALRLFPDYHYALAQLAKVRAAQEKYGDAAELLRNRDEAAPHAENLYDLAEALRRAGRVEEAQSAYSEFERKALAESQKTDNANHELVFYYADVQKQSGDALAIARREIERRQDVFTRDAYAWALHANGRDEMARKEIETALSVGIRDARLFYHAGVIALGEKDTIAAARYLNESLSLNPRSDVATSAREALRDVTLIEKAR